MIIALSGRKGSGKTTLGNFLLRNYRELGIPEPKLYNFADPLKRFLIDVFRFKEEWCYGTDEDKNTLTHIRGEHFPGFLHDGPMTAREVMQYFGTGIIRKMDPNAWVNATISKIQRDNPALALILDLRFPNEVEGVQASGGKVIRLSRNPFNDPHESEAALDNYGSFDYRLYNDGDLETAQRMLASVIQLFLRR